MVGIAIVYLIIGGFLSWVFIWSGNYKIKATTDRKITKWFKWEKTCLIILLWPYVLIKGLIQSSE